MTTVDVIGWVSASLTAVYLLPQIIKIIKTKNTKDISFYSLGILLTATVLWTVYGFLSFNPQVYVTNIFQASFTISIITIKLFQLIRNTKSSTSKR